MKTHFQRKEIKYYLTQKEADALLARLSDNLSFDSYCPTGLPYHIRSVYYDTQGYDVIRRSNDKPKYKAKLRLRTYDDKIHFLELKQKHLGVVYKQRIHLTEAEKIKFEQDETLPLRQDYRDQIIVRAIQTFIETHAHLIKPVYIDYSRLAYIYKKDQIKVRITFDSNILVHEAKTEPIKIIDDSRVLMEIKAQGSLPLSLVKALSEAKIYQTSFSKYGQYYEKKLKRGEIRYV